MSTVVEFKGLKFKIYPNDHNPPHVHVIGGGRVAVVELGPPLRLVKNTGFSPNDLRTIAQIIEMYRNDIMEVWNDYHG